LRIPSMGLLAGLADLLSIQEDGLRLLFSILAGYPLAAIYRSFVYKERAVIQYYFFIVCGMLLHFFNSGFAICHTLTSIVICWAITSFLPGTQLSVVLAHTCFLGHLLIGYWFAESAKYDIAWTTPFSVLTLRFIGLVMDVYDGQKKKEHLKSDQLKAAIPDSPSLVEIAAFGLFFSGTLVGPQFTLSRFRSFVNGEFLDKNGEVRGSSIMASSKRFVAGVFFAVLHQWGTLWVPDTYLTSAEFYNLPFVWKIIWNTIWFRATMYRYCTAFLLTVYFG
jgi:lysophospholipid acyltransferase 5